MADQDATIVQAARDLANPNWRDPNDRRCIAAWLVKVVYQLQKGKEREELVKRLCKLLKFEVYQKITENIEGKEVIFGVVFKWIGESKRGGDAEELQFPSEVVAFRGPIPEGNHIPIKDIKHAWEAINARLGSISKVDIGLQHLQRSVDRHGPHNIWIAGHSLGAAIAMAVARKMKKEDRAKIEAHFFNPPFLSPGLPEVKLFQMVGKGLAAVRDFWRSHGLVASNVFDFMMINDEKLRGLYNDFIGVSDWLPNIYVNDNDPICSSFIRYFEVMGVIYKQTSQPLYECMKYVFCFEVAEERTPWHLLPSANLFVNHTNNHDINQWFSRSLKLDEKKIVPPKATHP